MRIIKHSLRIKSNDSWQLSMTQQMHMQLHLCFLSILIAVEFKFDAFFLIWSTACSVTYNSHHNPISIGIIFQKWLPHKIFYNVPILSHSVNSHHNLNTNLEVRRSTSSVNWIIFFIEIKETQFWNKLMFQSDVSC